MKINSAAIKLFFFSVYFYFFMIPHKISRLFMSRAFKSGSLSVVGNGDVTIVLGERSPKHVKVYFSDPCKSVPCNNHFDELEFEILKKDCKFYLKIEWKVSDARTIVWSLLG